MNAGKVIFIIFLHAPIILFKLFIIYMKYGHKRRWAIYRFRKRLRKEGMPKEVIEMLADEYEKSGSITKLLRNFWV